VSHCGLDLANLKQGPMMGYCDTKADQCTR